MKRADRLQQLINHISSLKGDIVKETRQTEQLDKAPLRSHLNELSQKDDIPI